jgi:HK97 family phage major capsid protein
MKRSYVVAALGAAALLCVCLLATLPADLHAGVAGLVQAGALMPVVASRPRGLVAVRADQTPAQIIAELNRAFEAFKSEHSKEMADVKKAMGDVVQTEKVDRINAEITKLQAAMDEMNASVAAARLGGGGGAQALTADQRAHATAFDRFFRMGVDNGLRDLEVKASLQTQSDPDGGYVVPVQQEQTIDRVLATVSAMRQLATIRQVSSKSYKKLVNLGGAGSGWVGETGQRPQTGTPELAQLEYPVMELYANPAATQTVLDDAAIDLGAWLADEVAITFAEQEAGAFISGSGVNRPRGLLAYDTVANASYAWGKLGFIVTGAAADFATTDPADAFIDLVYGIKQGYRQNASFLMNRTVQGKVRKFKDGNDNYLWQPSAEQGQPATFIGYPIADDDNMPDVGANAFPVAFGDFRRGYLIVDRIGIRVLRDPYTNKPYVHFYTTKRVGGGVQNFEAIKLLKCST